MITQELTQKGLITPPRFMNDNMVFLAQSGSVSYGVSGGGSDVDIVGFCIPRKEDVFPHLAGSIIGFGTKPNPFQQWTQHHIRDGEKEYDFTVYSIVKFFQLCMENNPNMTDTLFTPRRCILHSTPVAEVIRENRKMFLHKGSYHKFKGYAYSQLAKVKSKTKADNQKRQSDIDTYGYDIKSAYHVVRLLGECEQILIEHDLDIERNREQLKSIRRGEWTIERIENLFIEKEKTLETLYATSTLQHEPDEDAIKELLLRSLESHYGSLDAVVAKPSQNTNLVRELEQLVDRYR